MSTVLNLRARVVGRGDTTLVLMHGFGAPGDDLVPLYRELEGARPDLGFLFPEAPMDLGGFFGGDARAWWMVDVGRYERALRTGQIEALMNEEPEGLAEAREALLGLLDALERDHGMPSSKIVLGGFSQGAMLATDVVLRTDRAFKGLVLLSGTLVARPAWKAAMPKRAGLPVFQSHGTSDPILPYRMAETLRDELTAAGLPPDWVPFPGGHEIPGKVLARLRTFLAGLS